MLLLSVGALEHGRIKQLAAPLYVARPVGELTDACERDCAQFIDDARAREIAPANAIAPSSSTMRERVKSRPGPRL
jgi:hypothetical protein